MQPVAWIVWASCAGMVAFGTTNPFYLGVVVAASWVVHAAHRRPGPGARSFAIFLRFAVLAVVVRTGLAMFGTLSPSSVAYAALEGARLGTILVVFGTFNAVTDPYGVLRLAPRRFHEPALAATLALSIAPRTISAAARVREAQELRGIRLRRFRSLPALAVPVLETGMEEAVTLAESMDARGHGRGRRTRYRPQPWTAASVAVSLVGVAVVAVYLAAGWAGRGDLNPSTFPLAWPEVSLGLVFAAAALALPSLIREEPR